jgi:glycosyltransferase involved in cell wall biosynthesis
MDSIKILQIYSDPNCSCTLKNTFEIQKGFKKINKIFDVLFYKELEEIHFKEYDVIVFQRLGGNGGYVSFQYLNKIFDLILKYKNTTLTVYTIDDLLLNDVIKNLIQIVDLVLVPNENYLKYYGELNSNFKFFKTFIDVDFIEKIYPKQKNDKFNILWASTGLLGKSFMENLIPSLLETFDDIEINIIGDHKKKSKTHKVNLIPITKYDNFIAHLKGSDLLLNPICDDNSLHNLDFINCKSEVKYANAGICRVPIITSKSYAYEKCIKNNFNGIILDNKIEEWVDAVKKIKNNLDFKNYIINNAYEDTLKNYNLEVTSNNIYNIYYEYYNKIKNNNFVIKNENSNLKNLINKKIDSILDISDGVIGELLPGRRLNQKIKCLNNNFFRIDFKFATYMRNNLFGNLKIKIKDSMEMFHNTYFETTIPISEIKDNSWFSILFDPIPNSGNKIFFIEIYTEKIIKGRSVTLYFSNKNKDNEQLYINKVPFKGSLSYRSFYIK